MQITVKKYAHQAQHDYCELTLTSDAGMQVKLLNYGATLEQVCLPINGHLQNVILSLPNAVAYSKARNYLGGTVGRVVGRIRDGQWQLGPTTHQLPLNDGHNHIHGGNGTDTQVFDFQPIVTATTAKVVMTLLDPAGHNGYPGNLKLTVTYTLDNQNQLSYELNALTDAPTLVNPTNHVYFRLDGPQHDIRNLTLQLNSAAYLPLDQDSLPVAGAAPVAGTPFDFQQPTALGTILASPNDQIQAEHGLNHPFLLSGQAPAAILRASTSPLTMTMTTDAPSIVVYTGNHFNHAGTAPTIGQYDGVALEAQIPPATGHNLNSIVLMPGEHFERHTSWQFS